MIGPWGRPRGVRVALKTLDQIRVRAITARRLLEISEPNIDMIDLLENRLRKIGIHFHIVEPSHIPGEAARAIPDEGMILLTVEAYDAIHSDDPDHQLLVPHELAHIALRHAVTFARATSRESHYAFEDSEVQADHFSHEFSMPVGLVQRHCQTAADIQRVFNVPRVDAQIRNETLSREGLISW